VPLSTIEKSRCSLEQGAGKHISKIEYAED
jgi:hypothetical protein